MAKQFTFQQSQGNRGAVHTHIGAFAPRAKIVYRAGNQFLPGAGFPMKQDGRICGRDDCDLFQHFLQRGASADNAFEAVLRADFWFDMKPLLSEPAHA